MMAELPFSLSLLFALPTTKDAFMAASHADPPSDYVRGMMGKRSAEDIWGAEDGYWRVCEAAASLIDQATTLGARVVEKACRKDLLNATSASDVVILCGHWRGDAVTQADLVGPGANIVERLRAAKGAEGDVFRTALAQYPSRTSGRDAATTMRGDLARILNRLIASHAFDEALGLADPHERDAIGNALARAVIDEALGPLIKSGNRLELDDGLFSEAEVERAISPDFRGELDLSACQSVYLARFLGASRAHCNPRPIFHHGLNFLLPRARFAVLRDVLALCSQSGLAFHEARARIEMAMIGAFRNDDMRRGDTLWGWLRSLTGTTSRETS